MIVGGAVALWGRKRSIDTYNKRVPAPIRRSLSTTVGRRVFGFLQDVRTEERRRNLQRELHNLDAQSRRGRNRTSPSNRDGQEPKSHP